MKVFVGTSGWQYPSWAGRFYPRGLPQREWLTHYTTCFPVVEVNNTFYMLPKDTTFDRWRDLAPAGFLFVIKANRYITHIRRMKDPADAVDRFWSRTQRLGDKLGPVLFQFPPNLRADPALLGDFLSVLPRPLRAAFEFRDDSWYSDGVHDLLDRSRAAWVLADRPRSRLPDVVTGGWTYVRFHQGRPYHPQYTRAKLRRWADRISSLGAGEAWAFFNNDPLAAAPHDARVLMDLLARRGQSVVRIPSMEKVRSS